MKKIKGFISIVLVIFVVIIALLLVAAAYLLTLGGTQNTNFNYFYQAFYLAESGIQRAIRELLNPSLTGAAARQACVGYSMLDSTTLTPPPGEFSAAETSMTYISTPTTLDGAISSSATTIPVTSATGYLSKGRILIDKEAIDYQGIAGDSFIGVQRGRDNTTAIAHASGTSVAQFQCDIQTKGGVPTIANPSGLASLTAGIQMQEAWAVGDRTSTTIATIRRWNQPTELIWNNANTTLSSAANALGVSALSYTDVWAVGLAVGSNMFSMHWNGSAWTKVTPVPAINKDMRAVYCNAGNDCWAVGQTGRLFAHWTGATWSAVTSPSLTNTTYRGVYCNAANDCWAVGADRNMARYTGGATWSNFSNPGLPSSSNFFGVWCNSGSDCWAVGASNSSRDFFVHWNGTNWTRDAGSPSPVVDMYGVTCTSSDNCWAVGDNSGTSCVLFHWNGSAWAGTTVFTGVSNVNLQSVACYNANDCWAVGNKGAILHYDGSTWSVNVVPATGASQLNAVAVIGAHHWPQTYWRD